MHSYAFLMVRALALVVIAAALWPFVAGGYNGMVARAAGLLGPSEVALSAAYNRLLLQFAGGVGMSIHGYVLLFGPMLVLVLVASTPGLGLVRRAAWLTGAAALLMALNIGGLALLAWALWWATRGEGVTVGSVMAAFAIFWVLVPAILGGAWCYRYWLPLRHSPADGQPAS